ncbi:MAG: hypothetical protein MUC83_02145 [Pirellula sp.]|jgi:hypothetical protein|nr:hypothetical protein [Pirellula sp.]
MSFFDFLFPEQAQAMHLRRLADQQSGSRSNLFASGEGADGNSYRMFELEERLLRLEKDLGFVSLVLGGVLTSIEQKGVATRSDVWDAIRKVDGMDNFQDGKLDIDVLRQWGNQPPEATP